MTDEHKSSFELNDAPLQMYAIYSGHRLITAPYKDSCGQWVALRVEWNGGLQGSTVQLTRDDAVRLAKRLLAAVDGNGQADMFFEWEGSLESRIFDPTSCRNGVAK